MQRRFQAQPLGRALVPALGADGRVTQRTDQRAVVIAFAYDNLRRPKSQKVTSLGLELQFVDGTVRAITRGYDSLGRVSKITSHGNQTDDPNDTTNVKNQVLFTYNDLGAYGPLLADWGSCRALDTSMRHVGLVSN